MDTQTTTTGTDNTHHDTRTIHTCNKSIREKIMKLFHKPVVFGKAGRGALLYSELPWLFDEKSWRSYFPLTGSNALREIYSTNLNQFGLRVAAVYGSVNLQLPDYVR